MADDIAKWLEGFGLGPYAQAFAENGIDLDILPSLSDDDLRELGLNLGDRRRVQRALQLQSSEIGAPTAPTLSSDKSALPAEAERRQLAVMFCDLVGSTELSHRLDPEDLREVMRRYQDTVAGLVARFEGHVCRSSDNLRQLAV